MSRARMALIIVAVITTGTLAILSMDTSLLKGNLLESVPLPPASEIIVLNTAFIGEDYFPQYFEDFQQFYELTDPQISVREIDSSDNIFNRLPDGLMIRHGRTTPLMGVAREPGTFYFTLRVIGLDRLPQLDEQGNPIIKHFKLVAQEANADFNQDGKIDRTDLLIYDTIMRSDTFRSNNPNFNLSLLQRQSLRQLYDQALKTAPQELY